MAHKILIGADICPTESNIEALKSGDISAIIDENLRKLLSNADLTIFNLEVPLIDDPHPIKKNGPNLIAPSATINGIKAINPHFFTLANNHIMDQGVEGLKSTVKALDESGIAHAGTGDNPEEASKPFIFVLGTRKIGVYCCAEHEFSIVSENRAGANPFDPLESPDHVAELKKECDYVIVLYHGGKEEYRYPSPNLRKTFRKLADKGADLVIAQHTHCIGCEEKHNGSTLVYGQGNFLFDMVDDEYWNNSLLINLEFDDEEAKISYIPIIKENHSIKMAIGDEGSKILQGFENRSREISEPGIVEQKYSEFAKKNLPNYLASFLGKKNNRFITKVINRLSGRRYRKHLAKRNYGPQEATIIQNMVECEAHRELMLYGLKDTGKKEK